jgi:hypothetical protein
MRRREEDDRSSSRSPCPTRPSPPPPPPPTADIVVLALVVPLGWGRRRWPRGIARASESNIISSCVTEDRAGIFDPRGEWCLKWFRSDFFYYVSLQRTCYNWEFRFLYEKGRISCFSYPGVRYYSTLPRSFARRHAKKASSSHSEFRLFYQKR